MKYLIVNNTTFDAFYQTAQSVAQASGPLSISYVERADADGKDIPGGWGCILRHPATGREKEFSGGESPTTNNQMELQAVIEGLRQLTRKSRVEVVTDSSYVAKGCTEWLAGWKARGWKTASKAPVKNVDLWQALDTAQARHEIDWRWIKGHAGHEGNERADRLANRGVELVLSGKVPQHI